MSITVKPGEAIPLELWSGNSGDQAGEYVILPVLDYRQITFAGSNVLHLNMPPGNELFLPGEIRAPDKAGIHELHLICVHKPYQVLDQEVTDPFVRLYMRSAIVVQDR